VVCTLNLATTEKFTTEIEASELKMLDRAPAMGNQHSTPNEYSDPMLNRNLGLLIHLVSRKVDLHTPSTTS
jgi:hypothetical protein